MSLIEVRIDPEKVLADHGIDKCALPELVIQQRRGLERFTPHLAHHAEIAVVEEPVTGLKLVEKKFGVKKPLPYHVARELAVDYRTHEQRLDEIGVRVAGNYDLQVERIGGTGVITVKQLFFPDGTLMEWLKGEEFTQAEREAAVVATIRDTIVPALAYDNGSIRPDESWTFSDSAPKNVAPFRLGNDVVSYYFDLYVPRVRHNDGRVKEYPDFDLHKRSEAEMQRRFFTKPGAVNNFIGKVRNSMGGESDVMEMFYAIVGRELKPFLEKLFPGLSPRQIGEIDFTGRNNAR